MVETCAHCQTRVLFMDDKCPSCGVPKSAAAQAAETSADERGNYDDIIFDGLWDMLEDSRIVENLVAAGCPREVAARLLIDEKRKRSEEAGKHARDRARNGWIVAILGGAVTIGTYLSASVSGGVYVVTWGAILWGIAEVYRAGEDLKRAGE